jgi:hypothetical protein
VPGKRQATSTAANRQMGWLANRGTHFPACLHQHINAGDWALEAPHSFFIRLNERNVWVALRLHTSRNTGCELLWD